MRIEARTLAITFAFLAASAAARGQGVASPAKGSPELDPRNVGLAAPHGLAIGPGGDVYIASPDQGRVFKVSPAGRLTIVAGRMDENIRYLISFNRKHGQPDPRQSGPPGSANDLADGQPASQASLLAPTGLAVDRAGNVFVSDAEDARVYRVDAATGALTTVAGGGDVQGDGGPATRARLQRPAGLAVAPNGDLLIVDSADHRVRRVDAGGRMSTVAGDGLPGDVGDGGPADRARLSSPEAVAVDARGDIYVADRGSNRIRRVAAATGVITTVAGTGTAGFSGDRGKATSAQLGSPTGVTVDAGGTLFIADLGNHRVRSVTRAGIISTFSDRFGATAFPYAVAADAGGGVLVSDIGGGRIHRISPKGAVEVLAGDGGVGYVGDGGPARDAYLGYPHGLAVDRAGNLYVADSKQNRIRRIDSVTGTITTVAGNGRSGFGGDGGPGREATLQTPAAVAVTAAGAVLIADSANHRIRQIANGIVTTVAGAGTVGIGGDHGPATAAQFMRPEGVGADGAGNLYVLDAGQGSVRRVDTAGNITTLVATSRKDVGALAVGKAGEVFVSTNDRPQALRYDPKLRELVPVAGTGTRGYNGDGMPAVEAAVGDRLGLALNDKGELVIADLKNQRLRLVDSGGIIKTLAGTGQMGRAPEQGPALQATISPLAVAVHPDGRIFVSDPYGRIFRIDRDGSIARVAGGGFGF